MILSKIFLDQIAQVLVVGVIARVVGHARRACTRACTRSGDLAHRAHFAVGRRCVGIFLGLDGRLVLGLRPMRFLMKP